MSSTPRNRYQASLREFEFQFFEQAGLGELLGKAPFENWGRDEVLMVLQQTRQFVYDVTGPLNSSGDRAGCEVVDGRVVTPAGFKDAWDKLFEMGLKTVVVPEAHGGQGGPHTLQTMIEEMLSGSNPAFNMYPGLAFGASELIAACATKKQQELFLPRMLTGKWGGTMCLTEPQAGSDVGAATTKATKAADGRYLISGGKIFITGGDHDLAENIIHLVLARIEGAPAGTKGLTLFIVPRIQVHEDGTLGEWNDVTLGGIEHKLGINGSATCVLNFGENGRCYGEPVGGVENEGIKQMFVMMNTARLAVAIQGIGVASSAFHSALSYAKERKQGPSIEQFKNPNAPKTQIINHPDIRRSLLEMKARVEGIRSLIVRIAAHADRATAVGGKDDAAVAYHRGQIELLTPIAKAYSSDQAFRVCETAVQVHGGAGFIKDYGVEQDLRDSKIFSIYEGTNHIQALDLVSRKLGQRGGANFVAFVSEVQEFCSKHREHAVFGQSATTLSTAVEALASAAMRFQGWGMENKFAEVALYANVFLDMFGDIVVGYLLLQGATIAQAAIEAGTSETAFYEGKKAAALWFANSVLSVTPAKAEVIGREVRTPLDLHDESFATL